MIRTYPLYIVHYYYSYTRRIDPKLNTTTTVCRINLNYSPKYIITGQLISPTLTLHQIGIYQSILILCSILYSLLLVIEILNFGYE
jgi:hypothetical protein